VSVGRLPSHAGRLPAVRASGRLATDSTITFDEHGLATLHLRIAGAAGGLLPWYAHVPLGTDTRDTAAAQDMLPLMRAGAAVSVAGEGFVLRTDHAEAVLRMTHPQAVLLLEEAPTIQPHTERNDPCPPSHP